VDHLLELTTVKEMRRALQSYPVHLDQAFESSLERINSQSKSHSLLAHRVIGWIVSAERKLLMSELIHGLGTEEGTDVIDDENLLTPKIILKVCRGLVIANLEDGTVSMVHTTVYMWFCNHNTTRFHEDLARSCLMYLTISQLSAGPAVATEEMDERLKSLPFLSYAAQNWRKHILDSTMESNLADAINALVDNTNFRSAAFQASNYKNHLKDLATRSASFEAIPTSQSVMHAAAYWNLTKKACTLLADGGDLNSVDSQGWTPLHWACFGKSQNAAQTLVSHGAIINAKNSVGWTPLFWAALNGDTTITELLLANKANLFERDIHGWTLLRWMVARQQTGIISFLLKHYSDNLSSFQKSIKESLKNLSVQEALRYSVKKDTPNDLLDELQDEIIKEPLGNGGFDDLCSILQDESIDLSQLWNRGHFDPPVGNVWRTMNKAEMARGVEGYISVNRFASDSPKLWRSRLLHAAIRDKKLLAVRLLIELGSDVNDMGTKTPLHTAVYRKDPSFAEILLEHGANIEALDYQGLTPLQQAVLNGFEETVRCLISKGANVNALCPHTVNVAGVRPRSSRFGKGIASNKTPLMLACGLSTPSEDPALSTRIIRLLLENGADVTIKDIGPEGMTALHYAARSRNPRVLEIIINAGADSKILDSFGRTSVHHLVLGFYGIEPTSPSFDPDGNCFPGTATDCLNLLYQKCGLNYLSQTAEWRQHYKQSNSVWGLKRSIHTPLSLAILLEDWELFQGLRRFGAHFNTNIPLDSMLDGPFLALQTEAVDILIENGAKFPSEDARWIGRIPALSSSHLIKSNEIQRLTIILSKLTPRGFNMSIAGWDKETLFHKAVCRSDLCELTKSLLEIGADPFHQNGEGLDSVILACLNNNFDALRLLFAHIKRHALANNWTQFLDHLKTLKDFDIVAAVCSAIKNAGLIDVAHKSGTILCHAARLGNRDFVAVLLKNDADKHLGDEKGRRPLHFSAEQGYTSVVELLIHSGVDLDVRNENKQTPLHLSALNGHSEVVEMLLSNGANPNVPDSQGWQPLHCAAWASHKEVASCLIKAGATTKAVTSHFTLEGGKKRPSGLWDGNNWTGTPLHLAAMAGNLEIVRLLLTNMEAVDINARTDHFDLTTKNVFAPPTPGGGPTALHIALDTKPFYGPRGPILGEDRLEIASMLVENGASVQGVADHLIFENIQKFEKFPQLWDKLRAGISIDD
jgi:ankyrin repeat protein